MVPRNLEVASTDLAACPEPGARVVRWEDLTSPGVVVRTSSPNSATTADLHRVVGEAQRDAAPRVGSVPCEKGVEDLQAQTEALRDGVTSHGEAHRGAVCYGRVDHQKVEAAHSCAAAGVREHCDRAS